MLLFYPQCCRINFVDSDDIDTLGCLHISVLSNMRGASSMDRVADFESVGWEFESLAPHQKDLYRVNPDKGLFYYAKERRELARALA